MEVIVIKKLFFLFVFLNFFGSVLLRADECCNNKYSFKDSLVQQYVDDYRALLPLYIEALNEKNAEKLQNLSASFQELGERSSIVSSRLTDIEEAQKFSDEMTEIAECLVNKLSDISNK